MKKLLINKVKRLPMPLVVKDKLEQLIKDRKLRPVSKLPDENELAHMLGVSRSSLREALHILEEEGVIVRRHGIGTFVREEARLVRNPLEVNFGVSEIIESRGLRAGTTEFKVVRDRANRSISEKLKIDTGSPIAILERVRTANGKPVVYTVDILSETILGKIDIPETFSGSLYNFLEVKYGYKTDYGVAKIIPTLGSSQISKSLNIPAKSLILLIDQVDYNFSNQPVMYSREYWRTDIFEFTIFRRRR